MAAMGRQIGMKSLMTKNYACIATLKTLTQFIKFVSILDLIKPLLTAIMLKLQKYVVLMLRLL